MPVPETLHATYAVAFAAPPADPRELAREQVTRRVAAPLRDLVLGMLDSPMVTLDLRPAAGFPPLPADLLAAYGAAPAELAAIESASHLLAVRAAYRPGWPPAHEWATRAIAGSIAEHVVDVFTPQTLTRAEVYRSLPGPDGAVRLTDWMLLPHTAGPRGFWFTTKGLARFGLPELQTENVPPRLLEPWGKLMNGLARRVLDLWLAELPAGEQRVVVDLPAIVSVSLRDVAAAQGAGEHGSEQASERGLERGSERGSERASGRVPREVRVRLNPAASGALTVQAADGGPDRLEALCTGLFGASSTGAADLRPCR
ncbi:hypothetical protein [Spirillospora sp. NBC_01491]|uniref:hypothetical protein n=1 Tax=Spirillospora sp. NBC_01491 TaxID=2976007 RepID=UPI002E359E89|nr:hypothetical protein [Spirillospora sp. NBC_01491]